MDTFTVYWTPKRNLTMTDCRKADTLNAGFLEQVLENLISWHDIKKTDLKRVVDYIGYEFSDTLIEIDKEKYITQSYCQCEFICGMLLKENNSFICPERICE